MIGSLNPPLSPVEAPVSRPPRRSLFSPVWIIPIISALLGLWLVWRHHSSKGPEIRVHFESAEGLIAGKTPVLCRSVPVGTVAKIELADDLKGEDLRRFLDGETLKEVVDRAAGY